MPFFPHTPESLVARSDSKNPATTCKGITSSGRPCRRSLAASPQSSSPNTKGVLAVLPATRDDPNVAAYFCWQHQDQAEVLANQHEKGKTKLVDLQERTSIDTLTDRLGVLDIVETTKRRPNGKEEKGQARKPIKRGTLPKSWEHVSGPLLAVPEDLLTAGKAPSPGRRVPASRKHETARVHFSFFCCGSAPPADTLPPPRPRLAKPTGQNPHSMRVPVEKTKPPSPEPTPTKRPPQRPPLHPTFTPSSETHTLLSLIPPLLSPQTTSLLLSELAKPLPTNSDPGYIYIFWLTPDSTPTPSTQTASSLLSPPSNNGRRASEIIQKQAGTQAKTIMLKIGRANNVQRRLNEWTRQCNYNLSLIRYYPYNPSHPTSPLPSPSSMRSLSPAGRSPSSNPRLSSYLGAGTEPRKVPHPHRVERLIHIELSEKRVKRLCEGCGKEHREWFEVDATREGVGAVDEIAKRWTKWALDLKKG
jgi:hypothetical protein